MSTRFHLQAKTQAMLAAVALLALPLAQAATMSKDELKAGKAHISDTYKADRASCSSLAANARDICVEEGRAKQKVANAELDFSYSGKASDRNKVLVAKAESVYAVAKEKCDDKSGNDKSVCRKEAKAIEVKSLVDARIGREVGATINDAASDKVNAEFRVATQKCEALAGDAQTSCMNAAKRKFGKV